MEIICSKLVSPAVIILSEEVKKVVESNGGKVKRALQRQDFLLDAIERENMNDMFLFNEDGEFDETYEWEGQGDSPWSSSHKL